MGFNDTISGYKKLKNNQGYSTQTLLDALKDTTYSFGEPDLGKVLKSEVIVFNGIEGFTVYIKVSEKSIEITRCTSEKIGKFLLKEMATTLFTDAQGKNASVANRAVDELYEVVVNLQKTGVAENKSGTSVVEKLYMRQKVLSIKDKYSVCTEDETPVYWVQGNLVGLSYTITDANENLIMEIKKKMIAVMPKYTILKNGEVLGTINKKVKLTRPEISGQINGEDIKIKGDISGFHFEIKSNDVAIGNVDTERLTWGDVYSIDIKDIEKQDLIVAIAIIVDNVISSAK
jgi:uncharacterized protein YxjI